MFTYYSQNYAGIIGAGLAIMNMQFLSWELLVIRSFIWDVAA